MKHRLTLPCRPGASYDGPLDADGMVPVGTVIEHPESPLKCRVGEAEPADEECRIACGMTTEQLAFAHQCAIEDRAKTRAALQKQLEDAQEQELEDMADDD